MIIISHNSAIRDIKPIKNYIYTKIQAECDFLIRLDHIAIHEVWHVEACGDSLLVEQVAGKFQCLEESLKVCLMLALISLVLLPNFKFGIFQGMKIKRPTC
jgi:hypothetical protein